MTQSQLHRPPLLDRREAYTAVTTATYTAKAGDVVLGVNRAGTVAVTLPSAEVRPGRIYTIKDESGSASSNNITVSTEGSETIDGSATDVISIDYGAKTFYSDGSDWFEIPVLATSAHAALHASGAADAVKLDDLAAPDDNTDLDFSTSAHGLVPKGTNTGDFLKDDGTWATAPSAISQANQAALEAETDEDTYVPPDLVKHSPGVAKAWVSISAAGAIESPDHNVASITDSGTGNRTIVIDTDFSSTVWSIANGAHFNAGSMANIQLRSRAAGSIQVVIYSDEAGATTADYATTHVMFGDQ